MNWTRRVAGACVVGAFAGLALVGFGPQARSQEYYVVMVILFGLAAGACLDNVDDERVRVRVLVATVPALMPFFVLGYCLAFNEAACVMSGGIVAGVGSLLKMLFVWLISVIAIVVGSFAFPFVVATWEYMTNIKATKKAKQASKWVVAITALIGLVVSAGLAYFTNRG